MVKHLYDLPVYRLEESAYNEQMESYIEGVIDRLGVREYYARSRSASDFMRNHLWEKYGGAWRFNEIIGFIRLHFLGNQVRGEWWRVNAKRLSRTRRKQFEYRAWKLASERHIRVEATSDEIYRILLDYVDDCRHEPALKNRHVDSTLFETVGPYVDWRAVMISPEGGSRLPGRLHPDEKA